MSGLRVSLFGRFQVRYGEHDLEGFDTRKVQELFCYLLLHRDQPHPRETLAALLWGDQSTTQSKSYLRKALWQLQTALDKPHGSMAAPILLVEPEWVQPNRLADIWLDIAEFERAFMGVRGLPGKVLEPSQFEALGRAVSLYKGDLLEGCYQDWCLYERERLQHLYLAMLDKLMDYCEAHQEYETGLAYGSQILRYDRARERTHRRLMRLQYLAGDRTGALRQFERCVAALDEELGVGPARQTLALHEKLRADQFGDEAPTPTGPEPAHESSALLPPKLVHHLRRLEAALVDLQRQVQQDIRAVESAMHNRD